MPDAPKTIPEAVTPLGNDGHYEGGPARVPAPASPPSTASAFETWKVVVTALEACPDEYRARVLVACAYLLGVEDLVKRNLSQWG